MQTGKMCSLGLHGLFLNSQIWLFVLILIGRGERHQMLLPRFFTNSILTTWIFSTGFRWEKSTAYFGAEPTVCKKTEYQIPLLPLTGICRFIVDSSKTRLPLFQIRSNLLLVVNFSTMFFQVLNFNLAHVWRGFWTTGNLLGVQCHGLFEYQHALIRM